MENLRIGIVGNIGVGKSSLVEAASKPPLSDILLSAYPAPTGNEGIRYFQEDINPIVLKAFYQDPIGNAFMSQIEFFNSRLDRQRKIDTFKGIVLEDRTIKEDYYIFGLAQKILGHMSEAEFQAYQKTFELMTQRMDDPDLIIFLKADVPALLKRIAKRSRDAEAKIPAAYLKTLNELYEQFISRHCKCPIVTINANEDATDLNGYWEAVVRRVANKIKELDIRVTNPGISKWVTLPQTEATLKAIAVEKKLEQFLETNPKLISIAGNVGSGKSTLAAIMSHSLGLKGLFENPEDNPLLEKFLNNKREYCYDLQLHFLKMRADHRKQGKSGECSCVKDRTLGEDLLVFCHQFNKDGLLTDRQLESLTTEFRKVNKDLPSADVMIVIKSSPATSWKRIQQRGREMEVQGGWSFSEIDSLNEWYKTYIKDVKSFGFHSGPIIEIDVDKVDLTNRIHVGYIFERIYEALTAPQDKQLDQYLTPAEGKRKVEVVEDDPLIEEYREVKDLVD